MIRRGSGILLHITSLPSPYGVGDFGPDAYRFVDFLSETHQTYWQILPLTLTCPAYGNSPYSSFSSLAGNILLISPERLVRDEFLAESDIRDVPDFSENRVNYDSVIRFKEKLFGEVYEKNRENLAGNQDFQNFCADNAFWLDEYALFVSIKNELKGIEWGKWPVELRDRKKSALKEAAHRLSDSISKEKFLQYIFFRQWTALKNYCGSKNVKIIGDIPIYVNYDSSDVWANPEIFSLDDQKEPLYVAGVPPDYFSSTGQLWGHPVYNWNVLKKSGYSWWIMRMGHAMKLFHIFRIDHFRGFVGFWQIHASEKTAINGKWVKTPAEDFFITVIKEFPDISIIAEDLGIITQDVKDTMNKFGFPGMKVLLFAFGEDLPTNPYAPHNHIRECVIYTGTHDNNTIVGWYKYELGPDGRNRVSEYIGHEVTDKTVHWELIRLAMMSVADLVIVPMQDILGLGEKDRMNLPASKEGNWEWRLKRGQLSKALSKKLADITKIYGRAEQH